MASATRFQAQLPDETSNMPVDLEGQEEDQFNATHNEISDAEDTEEVYRLRV